MIPIPSWDTGRRVVDAMLRQYHPDQKFSYVNRDVEPAELLLAAELGDPLPISMTNADNTIWGDDFDNSLYRAWHDCTHIEAGLGFDILSEIKVASLQLERLFDNCESIEFLRYFEADALGQVLYFHKNGKFPDDQREFCRRYVNEGMAWFLSGEQV